MKKMFILDEESIQRIEKKMADIEEQISTMLKTKDPETWLDNKEASQYLKVTLRTMQNYRDKGILPFSQVGSKIYYRIADLVEHLESHYIGCRKT